MNTLHRALTLAIFLVLMLASPAAAAEAAGPAVFADYWQAFLDYWKGVLQQQNGIVLAVLGVGAVALFIITRGKWRK